MFTSHSQCELLMFIVELVLWTIQTHVHFACLQRQLTQIRSKCSNIQTMRLSLVRNIEPYERSSWSLYIYHILSDC
ncbi:hypothetical protein EDB82DRAFT_493387 [Fusarium venenatum]|uniref:uncharacterized protein n=1 Tax=Fusarium venenatum TaxID=56646 RepID=UPI001DCC96C5|nr:hypothetical protein EDB82DRAFT_493387 [Fusarium venenatum]